MYNKTLPNIKKAKNYLQKEQKPRKDSQKTP